MTETTIGGKANGCLILILPVAFLIIFLFAAWPALLAMVGFGAGFRVWQSYQWQKWCDDVNPLFHQMILENQGGITPMELAMRGNFSGDRAQRYLDTKAAEFGAQTINYEDKGQVYYFITAGTLGSIFDSSEPSPVETQTATIAPVELPQAAPKPAPTQLPQPESIPVPPQVKAEVQPEAVETAAPPEPEEIQKSAPVPLEKQLVFGSLIQSELAKRLNVYSSTVYKRRNDPEFPEWSRAKDPDGIAWTFSEDTKEFFPVED